MDIDMAQVYTDFSGLAALKARAREDRMQRSIRYRVNSSRCFCR
jgi:hypothetical protein